MQRLEASSRSYISLSCIPRLGQMPGTSVGLALGIGARLHLIHPLGFQTDDKAVRRAGLDYWKSVDVMEHLQLRRSGDGPMDVRSTRLRPRLRCPTRRFLGRSAMCCSSGRSRRGSMPRSSTIMGLDHSHDRTHPKLELVERGGCGGVCCATTPGGRPVLSDNLYGLVLAGGRGTRFGPSLVGRGQSSAYPRWGSCRAGEYD